MKSSRRIDFKVYRTVMTRQAKIVGLIVAPSVVTCAGWRRGRLINLRLAPILQQSIYPMQLTIDE